MSFRRSLMRFTACSAVALAALAPVDASAQEQTGLGDGGGQDVIVTGSRIARPNLVSPNPVTQLNTQDIEQTGLQSVGELLNQLPQTANGQTAENNNRYVNGAGLQAINLRGLGAYRTLTLVDGRRHIGSLSGVNNSGGTGEVDTGVIAPLLIDHIDVVTGGSSAAYGADAVAGVVNFILKKNYQGAEVTVQQGQATEGGKSTFNVDAIVGANFADNRGNITVTADFQNQADIRSSERPNTLNDTQYYPNPAGGPPDNITFEGIRSSRNAANFAPTIATSLPGHPALSQVLLPSGTGLTAFNRGNRVPTFGNVSYGNTGDGFVATQFNNVQSPNNRKIVDALIDFDVADDVGPFNSIHFFADLKYADSRGGPYADGVTAATTGTFATIAVPTSNAYTPPDLARQLAGYTSSVVVNPATGVPKVPATIFSSYQNAPNFTPTGVGYAGPTYNIRKTTADWGLRTSQYEYEYYRSVVGFKGTVLDKFEYELYYNYGQNHTTFINSDRITQNLVNAVDSTTNAAGQIVCRSSLSFANGCVPINPFRVGPLTPEQNNYINTFVHEVDALTENDYVANLTTPNLISYPTPFSGTVAQLGFATGFEYREEDTNSQPDPLQLQPTGTIGGNSAGTRATVGGYNSKEFYVETTVPVLRDLPGFKALDFDGAIRYQNFSTTGSDYTWNARGTWAVTDDFKFRGGFAKTVRTPNGDELFSSGGQSFVAITDPCGGDNGINRTQGNSATRQRACAGLIPGIPGVPTYTNSPFASYAVINGNPNLLAETSQNAQVGGVLTPRAVPGLSASVDYYTFIIKNVITSLDPNVATSTVYNDGNPQYANLISHNADGSLGQVVTPYVNGGRQILKGVDFSLGYLVPMSDYGLSVTGGDSVLDLNFDASWIINNVIQFNGGANSYLAGQLGFPRLKWLMKGTYSEGPFSFTAATRYYSEQELNITDPAQGTYDHNLIAPQVYEDLYASYNWRNFKFFVGCQNLFDIRPSQLPTVFSGGNFPATFSNIVQSAQANGVVDNTGRYVFGGVTLKF